MNYRTNEDKLCGISYNNWNAIISVEDLSEDSGPVLEPATLQEVKDYLRLEGFTGGTPEDAFSYDDSLIEDMITEARMWVERFTGIHCVPKHLQVTYCNGNGYIELPGPVTGVIDGEALTLLGASFPKVKEPLTNEATVTYPAGYDYGTAPTWVKNAIKAYCAWAYEHRGDEVNLKGAPERAASVCRPYRRVSIWA